MNELRYTLMTDGSSDRVLLPILTWLLRVNGIEWAIQAEWADWRRFRCSKNPTLAERLFQCLEFFPCDLLFVHRDAEKEPREHRILEINATIEELLRGSHLIPPAICVVPVRMQEAWLLFDESAIRYAAGNRNSDRALMLPRIKDLEQLSDPKSILYDLLRQASTLSGRRLQRFSVAERIHYITNVIDDFSPLRQLSAFAALEDDIKKIITQQNWKN